jgi:hypothetical protein
MSALCGGEEGSNFSGIRETQSRSLTAFGQYKNARRQVMEKAERIRELEKEMADVKGTTCDVYSRVVGYHSPTSHWNEGKKEEFINRGTFRVSK